MMSVVKCIEDNRATVLPGEKNKILIVDDDEEILETLEDLLLFESRFEVTTCNSAEQSLAIMKTLEPDIALIDIKLGHSNGLDLLTAIKDLQTDTVCIMMTAFRDVDHPIEALRRGADDYVLKPIVPETLFSVLEKSLRTRDSLKHLNDSVRNLRLLFDHTPDLMFLLDADTKVLELTHAALNACGLERERVIGLPLRQTPWWSHTQELQQELDKVLAAALRGQTGHAEGRLPENDGGRFFDFGVKPVIGGHEKVNFLIVDGHDVTKRKHTETYLKSMVHQDYLTGLPNRYAIEEIAQLMSQSQGGPSQFAVLFIDLDRFKELNDEYGHDLGDAFLVTVSKAMRKVLREGDHLIRYGGDEFVVITGAPEVGHVRQVAKRLLRAIEATRHRLLGQTEASASIGIALCPQDGEYLDDLLNIADNHMYTAKRGGGKIFP